MSTPHVDEALALEHGLTRAEWERILEILGRTPSYEELGAGNAPQAQLRSQQLTTRWVGSPQQQEQLAS